MKVKTTQLPAPGRRVLLQGSHPSAGHTGVVLRHEFVGFLNRQGAVVDLDNGRKVGVTRAEDWRYVE